jgi:hypothetical protein
MIELDKFKESCSKKRCLRQTMYNTKICITNYKQEDCYKKYLTKQEKDKAKQDEKNAIRSAEIEEYKRKKKAGEKIEYVDNDTEWTKTSQLVKERDNNQCRLWNVLTEEEKDYCNTEQKQTIHFNKIKGSAHVIARSGSKNLFYELKNLYLLGWGFHFRMDNMQNPLTGKPATKEEIDSWWIRIVGIETWNWLQENK